MHSECTNHPNPNSSEANSEPTSNEDTAFFVKLNTLYESVVAPVKDSDQLSTINLTCNERCYSCDHLNKLPIESDPKYLIVKKIEASTTNFYCEKCKAPLLIELHKQEIMDIQKFEILDLHVVEVLAKKKILDYLLYPIALNSSAKAISCYNVIKEAEKYFLLIYPWSCFNESIEVFSLMTKEKKAQTTLDQVQTLWTKLSTKSPLTLHDIIDTENPGPSVSDNLKITFNNIDLQYLKGFKKFLLLDMDGTSSSKELQKANPLTSKMSEFLFRVLSTLQNRKYLKTIIATGKPLEYTFFKMLQNNLSPLTFSSNGNSVVYRRIEHPLVKPYYHFEKSQFKETLKYILTYLRDKYHLKLTEFIPNTSSTTELMIQKYYSVPSHYLQKLIDQDEYIEALISPNTIEVTPAEGDHYHISVSAYSKGKTLALFQKVTNLSKEDFFSIGNHYNDLTLKDYVANMYSVGNGLEEFKKTASYASEYVEAKGAIDLIRKHLVDSKVLTLKEFTSILEEVKKSYKLDLEYYSI